MADKILCIDSCEEKKVVGGEVVGIALVAAVLAVGILTVVVWKMYTSTKGRVQLPGGFKFDWETYVNPFLKRFLLR